jgi:hypothetical protein
MARALLQRPPANAWPEAHSTGRLYRQHMPGEQKDLRNEKAERRAARGVIAAYHQAQLRALLERVRVGFARLDDGEIDEFELDSLIHHYQRSATELWKFCGSTGGQWLQAARALSYFREQGDEPDWWEAGRPRRDRRP